jgi:hypothetical protein
VGLMNKHSTVFFLAALAVALGLAPERRWLRTRWPWAGAATALLLFTPNLAWQVAHGFPTIEDLQNVAHQGKNIVLGPIDFFAQQVILQHPVLLPLWIAGLVFLFAGRGGRYRLLGWLYVTFALLMFVMKGKNYYLAPLYPMLFAAGAVALETGLAAWKLTAGRLWPKAAVATVVVVVGAVTAPIVLPILAPARYVAYTEALGFAPPKTERAHEGPLPQMFGDQFGWPELVAEVARIHDALPPADRVRASIFANNYGEAGAINLFGPALGLPAAISGHQTYFFWGPRGGTGEVVIVLQADRGDLEQLFASVEEVGRHHHPWGMVEENRPIYLARGLKMPMADLWPRVKHWN